jgi:hypothetical protein
MVAIKRSLFIRASSDRQITAAVGYGAAGYPARLAGGEKQHRPDEIVGLAEARPEESPEAELLCVAAS